MSRIARKETCHMCSGNGYTINPTWNGEGYNLNQADCENCHGHGKVHPSINEQYDREFQSALMQVFKNVTEKRRGE